MFHGLYIIHHVLVLVSIVPKLMDTVIQELIRINVVTKNLIMMQIGSSV
jgi:hypothetical protein